jgi:hypothetical protein
MLLGLRALFCLLPKGSLVDDMSACLASAYTSPSQNLPTPMVWCGARLIRCISNQKQVSILKVTMSSALGGVYPYVRKSQQERTVFMEYRSQQYLLHLSLKKNLERSYVRASPPALHITFSNYTSRMLWSGAKVIR